MEIAYLASDAIGRKSARGRWDETAVDIKVQAHVPLSVKNTLQ